MFYIPSGGGTQRLQASKKNQINDQVFQKPSKQQKKSQVRNRHKGKYFFAIAVVFIIIVFLVYLFHFSSPSSQEFRDESPPSFTQINDEMLSGYSSPEDDSPTQSMSEGDSHSVSTSANSSPKNTYPPLPKISMVYSPNFLHQDSVFQPLDSTANHVPPRFQSIDKAILTPDHVFRPLSVSDQSKSFQKDVSLDKGHKKRVAKKRGTKVDLKKAEAKPSQAEPPVELKDKKEHVEVLPPEIHSQPEMDTAKAALDDLPMAETGETNFEIAQDDANTAEKSSEIIPFGEIEKSPEDMPVKETGETNFEIAQDDAQLEKVQPVAEVEAKESAEDTPGTKGEEADSKDVDLTKAKGINSYLWANDESEIMARILEHQFPKTCKGKNFLVYRLDHMSSRNVGSITRHVSQWIAEALISNRILVWGTEPWQMADCKVQTWNCYFLPISSCSFEDLPPHVNQTEIHDDIEMGDEKYANLTVAYAWRKWFRTTMGHVEKLLKYDGVKFRAYAQAFLLRQKPEIKAAIIEKFTALMQEYPDLDPEKTISMPMRRGDKCKGHDMLGSAPGEDRCLSLQTWIDGIEKFRCERFDCSPDKLSNVVITCGEEAVVRNVSRMLPNHGFQPVWNHFDVMQGTGSANDLQHFNKTISTRDVIISIFTNLQLQLRGKFFVKKKSRRYSSWIGIIEKMMTKVPEMTLGEGTAEVIFLPKYAKEAYDMEEDDHPKRKKRKQKQAREPQKSEKKRGKKPKGKPNSIRR